MSILPVHEHGLSFHFFVFSSISPSPISTLPHKPAIQPLKKKTKKASAGCGGDSLSVSSPPAAPGAPGEDAGALCISRFCPARRPPCRPEDKSLQFWPARRPLSWRGLGGKPCGPGLRTNAPPAPQVPGGRSGVDAAAGPGRGARRRLAVRTPVTLPSARPDPDHHGGYRGQPWSHSRPAHSFLRMALWLSTDLGEPCGEP